MRLLLLLLLCAVLHAPLAQAQPTLDYEAFKHIPVLQDGRVKPLDTFARVQLQQLSGSETIEGMSASEWLAQSMFQPDVAVKLPWIKLENAQLASSLGLPAGKDMRYTYREVLAAYEQRREVVIALVQKSDAQLSKHERAFLDMYSHINDYSHITRALTLVLPAPQTISAGYAKKLGLSGEEQSYLDLLPAKEQVMIDAAAAAKQHGKRLKAYSPMQQDAAMLAFYFANMEATGQQNNLLRIIPDFLGDRYEWYAPWALLQDGRGSPQGLELLGLWQQLAKAYHQQDAALWQDTATNISQRTTTARAPSDRQLSLEVWYHALHPVMWTMGCYGLAFVWLLVLICMRAKPAWARQGRLVSASTILLSLGAGIHAALILTRIIILERPPVSTLYESVLFVALISVLLAWRLDKHSTAHEGKLIASLLGVFLLAISDLFAAQGDTLGVLVAVLNTNFWLATHVVCITIGYGCAMVAGTMGHAYLLTTSEAIGKKLQTTALIALLFTAIGTILGGVWADQSWGRFWGWDPKENGALAIVIWLVWLLHGRITGHFKIIGFAALLSCTNIVVALSWFGVNLLGVGLHSYGFTNAAALGLTAFCFGELAIIIGLTLRAAHIKRKATS